MSEVRTRDEAIALVDRACHDWGQAFTGVLAQANAVVRGAQADAERVVRRCRESVSAIEVVLAAGGAEDRRRLEADLDRARASHDQARRAAIRISDVATAVGQLNRSHANGDMSRLAAARSRLAAMSRAIEGYRSYGVAAAFGGSVTVPASPSGPAPLASFGLSNLDVSAADLADTPIQGEFGRGGASRADYRWAVQMWNDTVGPGVAEGMTRDDFEARDQRNGAPPLRKTAEVFDMFLGTGRIRVDLRPDGSLNVVNGRHRLLVANDLGIKSLPGQVSS